MSKTRINRLRSYEPARKKATWWAYSCWTIPQENPGKSDEALALLKRAVGAQESVRRLLV